MTIKAPGGMPAPPQWRIWPLYAAGFTTAFGSHGVAANLAAYTHGRHASVLILGGLLALYDGAEIVLKPLFGSLADRIGGRPVLLGGLIGFAAASAVFALADTPGLLWLARLGQGAAASAFSPAAGALLARLNPATRHGRAFGSYGFYKTIGYTLGPLLGGAIVTLGGHNGLSLLFTVMAAVAAAVAIWAGIAVPIAPPLPRARQTLLALARRTTAGTFLRPTAALALAAAAISTGVGFLPLSGQAAHLGPLATGAAVSILAGCATLTQPQAGRALDAGRITARAGITAGLAATAAGFAAATIPGIGGLLLAAIGIGAGTGIITPLAFAALAATTPAERLGQTMGAAEIGRELGEAGGPLITGAITAVATLTTAYAALAALLALTPLALTRRPPTPAPPPDQPQQAE
ncbi:MAG TPA: MFS transporter [Streptosporangiaceae bacterium]